VVEGTSIVVLCCLCCCLSFVGSDDLLVGRKRRVSRTIGWRDCMWAPVGWHVSDGCVPDEVAMRLDVGVESEGVRDFVVVE
jgi:hypothetical protein